MRTVFTSKQAPLTIGEWTWPVVGYSITIDLSLLNADVGGDLDLLIKAVDAGQLISSISIDNTTINTNPTDSATWRDVKAVVDQNGVATLVSPGFGPISVLGNGASGAVVNDLTTGGTTVPLSAEQGKVLQATKYEKPVSGIPSTDLSSSVQTAISLASSALQVAPVISVAGKVGAVALSKADVGLPLADNTADVDKPVSTAQAAAISAKYTKPGTGIPLTDLAAAVQTSLGLANTALQSAPVTSVAGKVGAVALSKADVGLALADNTADVDKPVSTAQAAAINAKYTKPGTGIPATDLDTATQTSISTAYHKPTNGIPSTDLDATTQSTLTSVAAKYVKPGTGIPSTDLDTATQSSLSAIAGKYVKPVNGIPSTDLDSNTQAVLTSVSTKYVKPTNGIPETDLDSTTQAKIDAVSGKYTLPVGGIPETDMATAVQTKLDSSPTIDASNNATVGPNIFIPSGNAMFEKLLSQNNASLNGTTDDSAAFQAALNALPTNKFNVIRLPERVSAVKLNSGITFNVTNASLNAMGAMLDFSSMTSGQAWTETGGGTNLTYGQVMGGMEHAYLYGAGRTAAVDGVLFTGSGSATPNTGSARSSLSRSWIRNFRKGVTWYNRGYLTTLDTCEVSSNLIGYYSKGGAYDAYENAAAVRGACYNNDMNIYVEDGLLALTGVSVDYAEYVQMAVLSGFLQLDSCHVEYSILNNNYGGIGGIYGSNAPLCAFDLQPGVSSAIRNDIGLTSTTASTGQNWVGLKINGGTWAVTDPRAGTPGTNTLMTHANQGGNALFSVVGKPKFLFHGYGTGSGYICHNLTSYNTVGNFTSPVDWEGGFWDGSSDIPNLITDSVSSYLPGNLTQGLSIAPNYNLLGSYNISGSSGVYSFENDGEYSENVTIVEDSNGTSTVIVPTNRLIGKAGSVSSSTTFYHTGTKSLKITKTGAIGQPFKVAIDVPVSPYLMRRRVFRGVMGSPTTTGVTTGSVNVNLAFIKDDITRVSDTGTLYTMTSNGYLVTGGAATSASAAAAHCSALFKGTSGSLYADMSTASLGSWYAFQLNARPNTYVPAWAKFVRIEIDLKNMGPGDICFDSFDLQPM
ncbi:MAG TPA: hypothetical protein VFM18_12185 [Methanosarcina sp.]|nr:hypothetical protein [Methanosarcina sp.]